jgi:hypothetical protein
MKKEARMPLDNAPRVNATLQMDQSNSWRGLYFTDENGQPVPLETALRYGFTVCPNDAPAILTMAQNFVQARDERHQ